MGMGDVYKNFVYHLPIEKGFGNLCCALGKKKRIVIKCGKHAVVDVLNSGRVVDLFLGACAHNIWLETVVHNIDVVHVHILGKQNEAADLLSRWSMCGHKQSNLMHLVQDPVWVPVTLDLLQVDYDI